MKKALICIDFINDIIHPKGKLAGKGYADFEARHGTLARVAEAQRRFREAGDLVVHVRVGFSPGYPEHPATSPLFGRAKEFQALLLGDWGTEFVEQVRPVSGDSVLVKHRVSAFFGTSLDLLLRARGIEELTLAGVATDLAVEATARDAHDRDYRVVVLADGCVAAQDIDHAKALTFLPKLATVVELANLL